MSNNTILATAPLTATGYHLKATGTALGQSLIWDNGTNVGIGNTNTTYTLDVSGTGRFTGALTGTSATFSSDLSVINTSNALLKVYSNTTSSPIADIELMRGTNTTWGADAYTDYRIRSSGGDLLIQSGESTVTSTRLTIASTGAATFSSTITASAGFSSITSQSTTAGQNAEFKSISTVRTWQVGQNIIQSSTGAFEFYDATAAATRMVITSTGNVGIGTISPVSLLTIAIGNVTGAGQWTSSAIALYNPTNIGAYSQISFGYTTSTTNASAYIGYISTNQNSNGYGDIVMGTRNVSTDTQPTERMRITSGGAVTISTPTSGQTLTIAGLNNNWTQGINGSSTSGQSYGLIITAGSTSADSSFYVQEKTGTTKYFQVRGDGWLISASTYNNTSGTSANVGIDSAGNIFRATSSIKYKKDIKPYDKGLDTVLLMNPIYYKSISDFDGNKQFAGFIAEEIQELGLKEFVQYNDENNEPEGLNYGNITALLVKAIQEQQAQIQNLQEQINILAK